MRPDDPTPPRGMPLPRPPAPPSMPRPPTAYRPLALPPMPKRKHSSRRRSSLPGLIVLGVVIAIGAGYTAFNNGRATSSRDVLGTQTAVRASTLRPAITPLEVAATIPIWPTLSPGQADVTLPTLAMVRAVVVASQIQPASPTPEQLGIESRIVEGWSSVPEVVSVGLVSTRGEVYGELIVSPGGNRRDVALNIRLIAQSITGGDPPFFAVILDDGATASDWVWNDRDKDMRETRLR